MKTKDRADMKEGLINDWLEEWERTGVRPDCPVAPPKDKEYQDRFIPWYSRMGKIGTVPVGAGCNMKINRIGDLAIA